MYILFPYNDISSLAVPNHAIYHMPLGILGYIHTCSFWCFFYLNTGVDTKQEVLVFPLYSFCIHACVNPA